MHFADSIGGLETDNNGRTGLHVLYSDCLHVDEQSASSVCDIVPPRASTFIGLPVLIFSLSRLLLRTIVHGTK